MKKTNEKSLPTSPVHLRGTTPSELADEVTQLFRLALIASVEAEASEQSVSSVSDVPKMKKATEQSVTPEVPPSPSAKNPWTASIKRKNPVLGQVKFVSKAAHTKEDQTFTPSYSKVRIYVGGLPYSATNQDLTDLFSAHGMVTSASVITDKYTGQAKGFGFVEMSNAAEAIAAINKLNGVLLGRRTLTVNEAQPREERPRAGGSGSGRGGGYGGGNERGNGW